MANTTRLGLPMLQASQAQKHVTVNEALMHLDGLTQLVLQSISVTVPPSSAVDGDCYAVPAGAVNAWAGQDGQIAIHSNQGWVFSTPQVGWRVFVRDISQTVYFDGTAWLSDVVAISQNGATTRQGILEFDHTLVAGASSTIAAAIPAFSIVFGVTGRVTTAVTGTLGSWKLGVSGADNRYGSNLGLAQGSWVRGLTSAPQTYYATTDLLLSADGGDFAAGSVRLAIHYMQLDLPGS